MNQHNKNNDDNTGTKENLPCSGRGLCLAESGYCECLEQQVTSFHEHAARYATSNGRGEPGIRGDCGLEIVATKDCDYSRIGIECSGHGRCSYVCVCVFSYYYSDT